MDKIWERAKRCSTESEHENAWNVEVHGRLLDLVYRRKGSRADFRVITQATLLPEYVPRDAKGRPVGTKMVDFAITIPPSVIATERITTRLRKESDPPMSINQTGSSALCHNPLAISIETKTTESSEDDAYVQLCTWALGHFNVLRRFLPPGSNRSLPTLPLLSFFGTRLVLHFIIHRVTHFVCWLRLL
jgi:hypothetical protein